MKRRSKIFRLRPRSTGFFHSLLPQLFDFPLPSPLKVFEMLVVPEQEYPLVCVAISQGSDPSQVVRFETINLNSCSSWFTEIGTSESHRWKMVEVWRTESLEGFFFFFFSDNQQVDAIHVTQLERDTVLVCLDREYLLSRCRQLHSCSLNLLCIFFFFFSAENLKIVNLQGRLKSNKKLASELSFDFSIECVGELSYRRDLRKR